MRILKLFILSIAMVSATTPPARAVDAAAVDRCHQDILGGLAAVARGRIAHIGRCLKDLNYDSCVETDLHTAVHENELTNHVAGDTSSCRTAIDSGASVSDFGPLACANEWDNCDTEVPSISTLADLAECLICHERGFDLEVRDVLGMPRPAPTDSDERRCTRRIARLVTNSVRKSIIDTAACAEGNTKPFACPADLSGDSHFGQALATFERSIATCGIDEGQAPGALANLCGGTATDSAGLVTCFTGLAECLACHTANSGLGQTDDCAAFSGFAGCDGMF